ncbi:hypothetical protein [Coleofasciculus sp. E1-EBD-02]|uniref:hypothetical protein n=1 Tax=Coleofasciculus sp. E1-EBD-02 TaxID=3068481 RepID=UPI003301C969
MRPIDRGSCPTDATGIPKLFHKYQDARGDLITRIGEYCSFCETPLGVSLAVEHIGLASPVSMTSFSQFFAQVGRCESIRVNYLLAKPRLSGRV